MNARLSTARLRVASVVSLAAVAGALACSSDKTTAPRDGSVVRFRVSDPIGDTLDPINPSTDRAMDLRQTTVRTKGDTLIFVLHYNGNIQPPSAGASNSAYGFIDLDVDEDNTTGTDALSDIYGGSANIGVDFYIDFADGTATAAPVANALDNIVAVARASYAGDSAVFKVTRTDLGDSDGNLAFTITTGTADNATDIAPNAGAYLLRSNATVSVARGAVVSPGGSLAATAPARRPHVGWNTQR